MVALDQRARSTLDVYNELLGNPTLESELAAVVDGSVAYLGSISLSADGTAVNRGVGRIAPEPEVVEVLRRQFEEDFTQRTRAY